ncbi:hypothetical protein EYF80_000380 [Liparis tanakae]|uniref:Uncharacterized protein n=1 Tax=Liparis tanakae TaxID=230148 RepID=A0A4Z2JIL0_9TELE|nr:hypothetical protein EYF80_000380 [Liparis tanakae]
MEERGRDGNADTNRTKPNFLVARRFSALIRCCSSFLRRSSNCCSLSCRAFSSFSSHWLFLAAMMGGTQHDITQNCSRVQELLPLLGFHGVWDEDGEKR